MAVEPAQLGLGQRPSLASWRQTRPPQSLIGGQIAHAGHMFLVEETSLERCPAVIERSAQLADADTQGIGSKAIFGRVELNPAKSSWIAQNQSTAVDEADAEPLPPGLLAVRGVPQLLYTQSPIHDETSAHAEAKADYGAAITCRQ
jgi:hypothetical protein